MAPRWKGKGCEARALADPMSNIIQQLQCSLSESKTCRLLSGCSVVIQVPTEQIELLNRSCFSRPVITVENDKQWFQLGMEEAFYLFHSSKSLIIKDSNNRLVSEHELWKYMVSAKSDFPIFYEAYAHLRAKNWVVRPASQYGADFVAYRNHPALVHSEYAVLALPEGEKESHDRL